MICACPTLRSRFVVYFNHRGKVNRELGVPPQFLEGDGKEMFDQLEHLLL
jgi:hypothetical protein